MPLDISLSTFSAHGSRVLWAAASRRLEAEGFVRFSDDETWWELRASVVRHTDGVMVSSSSPALSRRSDAGISGIFRGGATPTEPERGRKHSCGFVAHYTRHLHEGVFRRSASSFAGRPPSSLLRGVLNSLRSDKCAQSSQAGTRLLVGLRPKASLAPHPPGRTGGAVLPVIRCAGAPGGGGQTILTNRRRRRRSTARSPTAGANASGWRCRRRCRSPCGGRSRRRGLGQRRPRGSSV